MKVGLFFGTFNPIHIGHMIIANYIVEFSDLDEVWFVITPQSPFKQKMSMLSNHHRLSIANIAVENYPKLKTSDIEFNLPQPNYTINTLAYIEEKYPEKQFCLIMGEDNLKGFHKWKNYQTILQNYELYVYPRISKEQTESRFSNHKKVHKVNAPIVQISSTFIRKAIYEKKDISTMLPASVWNYIDEMNFYKS
ncbi:MAG: nicotinate-nucleotide adenylyltransferase [Lutibacter sp.]|uniref:nicotinate (nicotinamide) nucleotide adenylyltransferase n=1 Tax=Lutibacter sp. TaxID=1925666 RepID=UPI001791A9C2|nr:nicotinate (nicotinamide) nucleotide adenylyltransferase [Lutibacter sp.]MBT8318368.1 nicotinate-nucleotide adenylyltransferase [Lutibacter sp.]NNJ59226.1 nicotinate-nucleotide adenylyltransferase [Lutibacter sp.]